MLKIKNYGWGKVTKKEVNRIGWKAEPKRVIAP